MITVVLPGPARALFQRHEIGPARAGRSRFECAAGRPSAPSAWAMGPPSDLMLSEPQSTSVTGAREAVVVSSSTCASFARPRPWRKGEWGMRNVDRRSWMLRPACTTSGERNEIGPPATGVDETARGRASGPTFSCIPLQPRGATRSRRGRVGVGHQGEVLLDLGVGRGARPITLRPSGKSRSSRMRAALQLERIRFPARQCHRLGLAPSMRGGEGSSRPRVAPASVGEAAVLARQAVLSSESPL